MKYSIELKLKVIRYCIENNCGGGIAAKHFNIHSVSNVKEWIRRYSKYGKAGLIRSHKKHSSVFKINVLKYMKENHLSFTETAIHFNLSGASVVSKWEHLYRTEGHQAFSGERRGSENMKDEKRVLTEKELIAENKRLRMENAYLKKLRALVQKRIDPKSGKK